MKRMSFDANLTEADDIAVRRSDVAAANGCGAWREQHRRHGPNLTRSDVDAACASMCDWVSRHLDRFLDMARAARGELRQGVSRRFLSRHHPTLVSLLGMAEVRRAASREHSPAAAPSNVSPSGVSVPCS
jgi:hypothetical protein